jgi:type III secretion protein J
MPRVVVRHIALVAALAAPACKSTLRGGLSEHEANQITLALDRAQITAVKVPTQARGTAQYEIHVARADIGAALGVLEREQLPRPASPGFAELYAEPGLVPSPAQERARWAAATAGELARSLERMAGVADARVHLAFAEQPRPLDAPEVPPKASVLIRRAPGTDAIDEAAVRRLVAGAVDGLTSDRVTIVQVSSAAAVRTPSSLVHVGPVSVTRGTALALKLLLGAALVLDVVLSAALVVLWRKLRRAQRDVAER